MSNEELQQNEILALKSIFADQDKFNVNRDDVDFENLPPVTTDDLIAGDFAACPLLNNVITMKLGEQEIAVTHLPPIYLGFQLPQSYPSESAPSIKVSSKWFSKTKLSWLCKELDRIWSENEGSEILYLWIDFIQDQLLTAQGISDSIDLTELNKEDTSIEIDKRAVQEYDSLETVLHYIKDYDKLQKELEFQKSAHDCIICFEEKPGIQCFTFVDCQHVFCEVCMTSHFRVKLQDGDVTKMSCPMDQCESTAYPHQLKKLLSTEDYDRYEQLLLQITLDKMPDMVYCPRNWCQTPVLLNDGDDRLGQCAACSYSFCLHCKLSYHGVNPCRISNKELLAQLKAGNANVIEAAKQRFSKEFVEALQRECATLEYMEKFTKKCPQCYINITKNDGCNKMTCTRCGTYFCWLCMKKLPRYDPYAHYSRSSQCRLFPGEDDLEPEEDEIEFIAELEPIEEGNDNVDSDEEGDDEVEWIQELVLRL